MTRFAQRMAPKSVGSGNPKPSTHIEMEMELEGVSRIRQPCFSAKLRPSSSICLKFSFLTFFIYLMVFLPIAKKVRNKSTIGLAHARPGYLFETILGGEVTFLEELLRLCKNERPTYWNHKVFIRTLDDRSALTLFIALLYTMSNFTAPNTISIIDNMINTILFSNYSISFHVIWNPRSKAAGSRYNTQNIFHPNLLYLLTDTLPITFQSIPIYHLLHNNRDQIGGFYCFQACFLVNSTPDHILFLRSHLCQSQQGHHHSHACSQRKQQHILNKLIVELLESTHCQTPGQLQKQTAAGSFGLVGHHISTPANAMSHKKVPASDKRREDATFPFTDSDLGIKVITIHESELIQNILNGQLIPGLVWELPLCEQFFHLLHSGLDGVISKGNIRFIYELGCIPHIAIIHQYIIQILSKSLHKRQQIVMKLITALVFLISSWPTIHQTLTVTHPKELVQTLRTSQVEVHASPIGFKPRSGLVHGVARIASPHSACSTLSQLPDTEDDVFMMADDSGCLESVKAKSIAETGAFLGLIKRNINNTLYDREVNLVHIPILEVDPQFYDNLTSFMNDNPNTPITLIASFQRELKHRIKVDFWLTPTEKHSYQFANQMRGFVTSQARDIYFQPRFVLHSQEQRRQYVGCLSSGRFCPVEVEFEGKTEGINIVKESLRQIIIAEKSMSAWFKYAHYYYRQCLKNMGDKLWEDDNCQVCSEIAMRSANINVTEIQTLYNASFQGSRPEVDMNTVLEEERYLYIQEQLTRYPSVLINKKQYNKLNSDYIQREICFKMHPDVHQQSSECQKLTNPSTFSVGEIFLGAGLVLLVIGLGIFAFRWMINRRIKRELKGDVDRTLQQYYRYMETFEDDDPSQPKPLIPSKSEKKEESNQIGSVELAQIQGKKEDEK